MKVILGWLISYRICLDIVWKCFFRLIIIERIVDDRKCFLRWALYYFWGDECEVFLGAGVMMVQVSEGLFSVEYNEIRLGLLPYFTHWDVLLYVLVIVGAGEVGARLIAIQIFLAHSN